jgi:hypothetical protein
MKIGGYDLRKIGARSAGDRVVNIYRNSELGEYVCRLVGASKADYFTDDKADAFATAKLMAESAAGVARPGEAA